MKSIKEYLIKESINPVQEKYPDVKQKYRFELADSEYKLPEVHTSEITDFYLRQSKENR